MPKTKPPCPQIKAIGADGIIAVGRKLRDDELFAHVIDPGNGEEAVYIPHEVVMAYVTAVLQLLGVELIPDHWAGHDQAHVAQAGGTDEKTSA